MTIRRAPSLAARLLPALVLGAALRGAGAQAPARVAELPFDSAAAARLPHQGSVVGGRRWRDAAGEHTLLLAQSGRLPSRVPAADLPVEDEPAYDAEVYAYQYTHGDGGAPTLVWRTVDFERGCQFDLYAGHLVEGVSLTDLDADGVAETTFLYSTSCRSDASPATRKLIMHEGKAKYAIRGTTRLQGGIHGAYGGAMSLDPAFAGAPASFRAHAVREWKKYVAVDRFEQLPASPNE